MSMKLYFFAIFLGLSYFASAQVNISEGIDEGQEVLIITTKIATYYYQKAAGGFSSIVDKYGNDWINYTTDPKDIYPQSAASTYRGLPNLVHGGDESGTGHPGFKNCTSEILNHNTIISTSKSGNWEWEWTFSDSGAVLNITKIDPKRKYWFLYEGTIGGNYDPEINLWGNDVDGLRTDNPDFYKTEGTFASWQTVFFGNQDQKMTFFINQVQKDRQQDVFGFLGNSKNGLDSPNGMVVFGFGRGKGTTPLLNQKQQFVIGFVPKSINKKSIQKKIIKTITSIHKDK